MKKQPVTTLIAIGTGLGGAMGLGGSLIVALTTNVNSGLLLLVAVVGVLVGAAGGALSAGASAIILRSARNWPTPLRVQALITGSVIGALLSYLVFFIRLDSSAPALLVSLPAAVIAAALARATRPRASEPALISGQGMKRRPHQSLVLLALIWSVVVAGVVVIALAMAPAAISEVDFVTDFSALPRPDRMEIIWRLSLFFVISISALALVAKVASEPSAHSARHAIAVSLMGAGVPSAHTQWLSQAVVSPLMALKQSASSPSPLPAVLTVVGIAALVIGASLYAQELGARSRASESVD